MDALKNAMGGNHSGAAGTQQPAVGQEDYVDKVADFGLKKSGHGGQVSAGTREKITDGARGLYEKATGTKVNPKISN